MGKRLANIGEKFITPGPGAYNIDNALIQLLSHGDAIAVMPGFSIPQHPQLCAVPLMDGICIRVGLAYRHPMTRMEEAFAVLARELPFPDIQPRVYRNSC